MNGPWIWQKVPLKFRKQELRVALARKGWSQLELAKKLGYSGALFSAYMCGIVRTPTDLVPRMEKKLGLRKGTLVAKNAKG
jgi:transcriptional regulator with XRE-family HTH domain